MPHVIARSTGPQRQVVVVGAGPAGWRRRGSPASAATRWCVFEAGAEPGGQVRLTASLRRRREILGIIDWRVAECERLGVEIRFNVFAEADGRAGGGARHRGDRHRRAAQHLVPRRGRGPGDHLLGHPERRREARRPRSSSTTTTARIPA